MKNLLYIGNNLSNKKSNLSGIQILGPLLQTEGFKVFFASSKTNKLLRLLDMIWSCFKWSKKIDVVLIDTYSTQNFYYAFIVSQICRWLKLEYIPILHGGNLPSRLQRSPKLSNKIFKNAKYNVAPSFYLKEAFEHNNINNIVHIPNTIEIENYPFKFKAYNDLNLLWVRSFSEIYNPEMAVHVMHKLKDKFPDVTLCMVGPDTNNSQSLVAKLAADLKLDVRFTGKLKKEEWITLSDNYNVFINTTNFDNTPVSLIEAMALGLPIVSTNVGGIPYLIEDGVQGLLVPVNDVEDMALSIENLMKDSKKRNTLIKNARLKAESFDWNSVKSKWLKLLN